MNMFVFYRILVVAKRSQGAKVGITFKPKRCQGWHYIKAFACRERTCLSPLDSKTKGPYKDILTKTSSAGSEQVCLLSKTVTNKIPQ